MNVNVVPGLPCFSAPPEPSRPQSDPLAFEDLDPGNLFIAFPRDGDDSGHGGYRPGQRLFKKLAEDDGNALEPNAVAVNTETKSHMPASMPVLRII